MHRRSVNLFLGKYCDNTSFPKEAQGNHSICSRTTRYNLLPKITGRNYRRRSIRNRKAAALHQRGPRRQAHALIHVFVPVLLSPSCNTWYRLLILSLSGRKTRGIVRHPADERVLSSKLTGERILIRRVERPAADLLIIFHDRDNDCAYLPRTRVL
jgi:hypothetical protein